jgi:hypothetical protein
MNPNKKVRDEMRPEYDWSRAVPARLAERFNLKGILLDRDLLAEFETSQEIEQALREYLKRRALRKRLA